MLRKQVLKTITIAEILSTLKTYITVSDFVFSFLFHQINSFTKLFLSLSQISNTFSSSRLSDIQVIITHINTQTEIQIHNKTVENINIKDLKKT